MASLTIDTNGNAAVYVTTPDGRRRPVRLGKVGKQRAERIRDHLTELEKATRYGIEASPEPRSWLVGVTGELRERLARAGLCKAQVTATLAAFTQAYIDGRVDIKPRTRTNLEQARAYMLGYFDGNRPLRDIGAGDAQDFRLDLIGQDKADNTVRRAIGRARQFFKAAMQRGLIERNPFEGLPASMRPNRERFHFVSRDETDKVLDACPDIEWQVIVALARYGGLRCPSEVLALTWPDVNWEADRIRVPSPKTEHLDGKGSRMIPLFPELRGLLLELFEQAEPGTEHVITRYRGASANLRTQLHRIIRRAGLEPWPKTFQNMRSTRETELAEEYPLHVATRWIGNSQIVADQHYLQLPDEHFDRAVRGTGEAVRNAVRGGGAGERTEHAEPALSRTEPHRDVPNTGLIPPAGVEPATNGLEIRCSIR